MLSDYGMVLIYVGSFGLSDLLVKICKFSNIDKFIYYILLFMLGSVIFFCLKNKIDILNNFSDIIISNHEQKNN